MGLPMLFSFLVGLTKLESLNLSFTLVTDSGLKKLCQLTSLKSLNLDVGLVAMTSKHLQTLNYHCLDVNIYFIQFALWNHLYDNAFHFEHLGMVTFRIVTSSTDKNSNMLLFEKIKAMLKGEKHPRGG